MGVLNQFKEEFINGNWETSIIANAIIVTLSRMMAQWRTTLYYTWHLAFVQERVLFQQLSGPFSLVLTYFIISMKLVDICKLHLFLKLAHDIIILLFILIVRIDLLQEISFSLLVGLVDHEELILTGFLIQIVLGFLNFLLSQCVLGIWVSIPVKVRNFIELVLLGFQVHNFSEFQLDLPFFFFHRVVHIA